ncbi:MAG: HlyC/CorC family transporter [Lachnospiraceae bacterium]|nr:HlyC/CorC family transporter [Lachnospiraceae bacterium]
MDTTGVIQLVTILVLVGLSAFFSSAETAFTTVNRVRMKALADEGNSRASAVLTVLDHYSKMLSTILIGNNIVNLTASSLTTILASKVFGSYAVGIATGILTLTILIFGEIIPKNTAMIYSDKISLIYAKIILFLMKIFTPVVFIIDRLSMGISRLLHIDMSKKGSVMTENELKTYVDVSHEDGVIESEEREIIYNIFDFSDAVAKDIMIPRIDMVSIGLDMGYEEVLNIFKEYMYTRLPVFENDKDNIVGLINIKDFILLSDKEHFQVKDILREAYYTYEYKKTADLMIEMREITANVAFVLNEYGATVGMITLEDLLEEIVGEIRDEYDADEEELIQQIDGHTYLVEGGMKLDDINDALDISLHSEDYDSIGGLIIEHLDRLPEADETIITEDGITLQVKEINQNRIKKVSMTLPEETGEDSDTGASEEDSTPSAEQEQENQAGS